MSHSAPKTRSAPRRSSRKSCTSATFGGVDPVLAAMPPSLTASPRPLPESAACHEVDALARGVGALEALERVRPVSVEPADLEPRLAGEDLVHVARLGAVVVRGTEPVLEDDDRAVLAQDA